MKNLFTSKNFNHIELDAVINATENLEKKKKIILKWQKDIESEKIYQQNETQLDMLFIHQIFGEILGYEYQNNTNWQIEIKPKTLQDSTRPDATLGYYQLKKEENPPITKAIIELKGATINLDKTQIREKKGSPIEQAFGYVPKMGGKCEWVIVSNFLEIRLYHASDSSRYEKFEIMTLLEDKNFEKFLFLFQKDRLFLKNGQSRIAQLLEERRIFEQKISNEFYEKYEQIRQALFFNFCQENPKLNKESLKNATQKLLDRVIFMCFVRDNALTVNILGKLKQSFFEWEGMYEYKQKLWNDLKAIFKSFDKGSAKIPHFNGGLFKNDEILDQQLYLEDTHLLPLFEFVLKYDFQSELNVNLLGHIFEQSLSADNLALNSLQAIRKQDGIFYTPDFITKYITKITIRNYLETQKNQLLQKYKTENLDFWEEYQNILKNIKILDPACGSGAFLTQVFVFLFDEWQIVITEIEKLKNNGKQKIKKRTIDLLSDAPDEKEWKIKKMIVQNNIFGFDLNNQSVQITQLALWLLTANKVVTLADLSNNILEINTLTQANFPQKFDIIIGNPPYVRQELLGEKQKNEYKKLFPQVYNGMADLYVYFYAKALELLKPNGILGFITPNKWFKTKYGMGLRNFLKPLHILQIIDFFELRVFEDASTEPMIITLKNALQNDNFLYFPISQKSTKNELADFAENLPQPLIIQKNNLKETEWIFVDTQNQDFLEKITGKTSKRKIITLNEYTKEGIFRGITTGLNKAFIIDAKTKNELIKKDAKSAELIKPYIQATDIKKWHLENKKDFYFINTGFDIEISSKSYPAIFQYLKSFEDELKARQDKGKTPYNLRACAYYEEFEKPKIMYIHTALKHQFYYDTEGFYLNNSSYFISNADLFLSVFLNSKIFEKYKKLIFVAYGNADEGGRNKLDYNKMIDVPVPVLSATEKKPFEDLAIILRHHSEKQQKLTNNFLTLLRGDVKGLSMTSKLEKCFEFSLEVLQSELKKQKVSIPLKQKTEYLNFFNENQIEYQNLQQEIEDIEQQLDEMLWNLY